MMNQRMPRRQLQLGRGLRILRVEMVQKSGEVETYDFTGAATTVLTGPRNSSKTTTLKVIDFCLGGRNSVAEDLGAALEEKYVEFATDIAIDGTRHRLVRGSGFGQRGRVQIDDEPQAPTPAELSDWLLRQLGWPQLQIPLGRNFTTATQQTPLTFRALLRHIYRREDSWTDFAIREQEYLRRAVISLFLGFAPQRYETAEFDLGRAQREWAAAMAVEADVLVSTEEAVRAIVTQLGLPPVVGPDNLDGVRAELTNRLMNARARRDSLASEASDAAKIGDQAAGLDPSIPKQLEEAAAQAADAAERAADLAQIVAEHERSLSLVEADTARMARLVDAVDAFDELPVRLCPACEQDVEPNRARDLSTCYLCSQPVSGDVRRRRAEREQRALASEHEDLTYALARARADLDEARIIERRAAERRTFLAKQLQDVRIHKLAPFVAALEDLATEIGHIEQRLAALPALSKILARRTVAEQATARARAEVDRLSALLDSERRSAADITQRCSVFADYMNNFLQNFRDQGWVPGQVAVLPEELTFYVGSRPWDDNLGAEAKVLFFFAYSYALLRLTTASDAATCPPGVLLLDNPYQQGLTDEVVSAAVARIADAANDVGAQVLLTQARPVGAITAPYVEIPMSREFAP
jgi:hypothetical protein